MADPPALHLLVEKGPRKGESLQCPPGAVTRVGRVARGNSLAVRDPGASQQHLAFEFLPASGLWALSDLASSNGTLLNGAPVAPSAAAPLADGDRIKIGESTIIAVSVAEAEVVRRGGRSRAAPPPPPPARARSARVAAKKGQALGGGEEEVVVVAKQKGRVATRASARKGKEAVVEVEEEEEEEEEEEVFEPEPRRGRRGRPAKAGANLKSALKGGGGREGGEPGKDLEERIVPDSDDEERAAEGIPKALEEEVPVSVPRRGRRGRPPKAGANLANVAKDGEEEGEEERALGEGEGDRIVEDMEGRTVPGSEQEGERAAPGGGGGGQGTGKTLEEGTGDGNDIDLDKMTLGQWFDRMEWYLPKVINDVAEEMIADLREKARMYDEYLATSSNAA